MRDKYEQLEKLAKLKEQEVLTEAEFLEEKKKILNSNNKTKIRIIIGIVSIFLIIVLGIIIFIFSDNEFNDYSGGSKIIAEKGLLSFFLPDNWEQDTDSRWIDKYGNGVEIDNMNIDLFNDVIRFMEAPIIKKQLEVNGEKMLFISDEEYRSICIYLDESVYL